jgi:hypothetical protein
MFAHDPPFTVAETAKIHGWSQKVVYRLIHQGCPTVRIGRQHYLYLDTLDSFLRAREVPGSKDLARGRGRSRKNLAPQSDIRAPDSCDIGIGLK